MGGKWQLISSVIASPMFREMNRSNFNACRSASCGFLAKGGKEGYCNWLRRFSSLLSGRFAVIRTQ
jgi:hypothetical protein